MSLTNQELQVSLEHVTREQFLKERRLAHSTTTLPLPIRQFHRLKTRTKLPTPWDRLNLELVTSPPKKKSITTFRSQVVDAKEDEE